MSNGVIIIDPSCFMCHASRRVCRTPVVYAINGKVLVSKICILYSVVTGFGVKFKDNNSHRTCGKCWRGWQDLIINWARPG